MKFLSGLNPCCSGRWSRTAEFGSLQNGVLSLNPYCSGQWSHTSQKIFLTFMLLCLNPCCKGRWSRTAHTFSISGGDPVLILVVMEDGLVLLQLLPTPQ